MSEHRRGARHSLVRTTISGAVLFLVPAVLLAIVVGKGLVWAKRLSQPVARFVPLERVVGIALADLIAIAGLLVVCFLAGLLVRLTRVKVLLETLESNVLWNIPGYAFVKSATASIGPVEGDSPFRVVLCRLDDASEIGYEVERLQDGRVVVFVPAAPVPWSGSVMVIDATRVEVLDCDFVATLQALRRFGLGTGALLGVQAVPAAGRASLPSSGEA